MSLCIDLWNKIVPSDLTEFENYWNYCTAANGICIGVTLILEWLVTGVWLVQDGFYISFFSKNINKISY